MHGFQNRSSSTPGLAIASPSHTRGGSRMRESRTYGSVRGALSNERPYRVRGCLLRREAARPFTASALQVYPSIRSINSRVLIGMTMFLLELTNIASKRRNEEA